MLSSDTVPPVCFISCFCNVIVHARVKNLPNFFFVDLQSFAFSILTSLVGEAGMASGLYKLNVDMMMVVVCLSTNDLHGVL